MIAQISEFRMPRYREIPDVGLYLDQTVKYMNRYLAPLGCMEITTSMVSNYVKKGVISHPVKKKYTRDQLACLIYIIVSKNVLSMENIDSLFKMQRAHYTSAQAYDTFCDELENYLPYVFGLTKSFSELEPDVDDARKLLRSTIISAVNKIYLDCVFTDLRQEQALWPDILPDLA